MGGYPCCCKNSCCPKVFGESTLNDFDCNPDGAFFDFENLPPEPGCATPSATWHKTSLIFNLGECPCGNQPIGAFLCPYTSHYVDIPQSLVDSDRIILGTSFTQNMSDFFEGPCGCVGGDTGANPWSGPPECNPYITNPLGKRCKSTACSEVVGTSLEDYIMEMFCFLAKKQTGPPGASGFPGPCSTLADHIRLCDFPISGSWEKVVSFSGFGRCAIVDDPDPAKKCCSCKSIFLPLATTNPCCEFCDSLVIDLSAPSGNFFDSYTSVGGDCIRNDPTADQICYDQNLEPATCLVHMEVDICASLIPECQDQSQSNGVTSVSVSIKEPLVTLGPPRQFPDNVFLCEKPTPNPCILIGPVTSNICNTDLSPVDVEDGCAKVFLSYVTCREIQHTIYLVIRTMSGCSTIYSIDVSDWCN